MFRDEVSEEYYCDKCETHVTEGSKHCRRCNRCAKNFDHHCIWLNNCIGYNNYTSFIVLIVLFWFQLAFQISLHATLLTLTLSWQTIVNHVCLVECGFIIVPLTYLVGYHFWLINKNFQIGLDNLGLDIVLMNLLANTNQSFCRSTSHFVDHDNIGSTPT